MSSQQNPSVRCSRSGSSASSRAGHALGVVDPAKLHATPPPCFYTRVSHERASAKRCDWCCARDLTAPVLIPRPRVRPGFHPAGRPDRPVLRRPRRPARGWSSTTSSRSPSSSTPLRRPSERLRVVHIGGGGADPAALRRRHPAALGPAGPRARRRARPPSSAPTCRSRPAAVSGCAPSTAALAWLRCATGSPTWSILDAFVGPRTPAELTTLEFLTDAPPSRWPPTATMIINVTDRGPLGYARRVLAGLARSSLSGCCWRSPRRSRAAGSAT